MDHHGTSEGATTSNAGGDARVSGLLPDPSRDREEGLQTTARCGWVRRGRATTGASDAGTDHDGATRRPGVEGGSAVHASNPAVGHSGHYPRSSPPTVKIAPTIGGAVLGEAIDSAMEAWRPRVRPRTKPPCRVRLCRRRRWSNRCRRSFDELLTSTCDWSPTRGFDPFPPRVGRARLERCNDALGHINLRCNRDLTRHLAQAIRSKDLDVGRELLEVTDRPLVDVGGAAKRYTPLPRIPHVGTEGLLCVKLCQDLDAPPRACQTPCRPRVVPRWLMA
jgi:hypothetical protein